MIVKCRWKRPAFKELGSQSVLVQELGPMEIHRSLRSKLLGIEICKTIKGK
jgi:hypothetical protein